MPFLRLAAGLLLLAVFSARLAAFEVHPIPDVRAVEGQRVELRGTWTGDATGAVFQWRKDGAVLPGQSSATLVLPSFQFYQAADYQFAVLFPNASHVSPPARVSLEYQVTAAVRPYNYVPLPAIPSGVIRIAGSAFSGAAVKADGTVVAWGFVNPPAVSDGPVADVALEGSLAFWLMNDGTVGTTTYGYSAFNNAFIRIPNLTDAVAVAAGGFVLRRNGTVIQCGRQEASLNSFVSFPSGSPASRSLGLHGVVDLSNDRFWDSHSQALLRDGTVVAVGNNDEGQSAVPPGLTGVVAVGSVPFGSVALQADGAVAMWGNTWTPPIAPPGEIFVALSRSEAAFITSGGKLIALDPDVPFYGDSVARLMQWNPSIAKAIEPVLAADSGGALVMSALDPSGQPHITNLPEKLAGKGNPFHFRILAKNRPVSFGATGLPPGLQLDAATGVISGTPTARGSFPATLSATTAAGATATKPLRITVLDKQITAQPQRRVFRQPANHILSVTVAGEGPFSYQWQKNGVDIPGATGSSLSFSPAQESDAGNYACLVTDADGTLASAEAALEFVKVAAMWAANVPTAKPPAELTALRSISTNGWLAGGMRPDGMGVWWNLGAVPALHNFNAGGNPLTDFKLGSWTAGQEATGQIVSDSDFWNGNGIPDTIAADWNAQDDTYFFTVEFDGRVRGTSLDSDGYSYPQPPYNLKRVTRIAVGRDEAIALLTNGNVVNWLEPRDAIFTNAADIAAGWWHDVALLRDGTVRCWGNNNDGQCNVPPGLTNVVQVAAGARHTLALKADGTVVGWGFVAAGEPVVPAGLDGACAIASAESCRAVLLENDPVPGPARVLVRRHHVAAVGDPFFLQLAAQNQPTAWNFTNLPPGFTFDAAKRQLTGTPTSQGDITFQITVANAIGGETVPVTLHVLEDPFLLWANAAGIAPDREADPDRDGLNNLAEFAFGLDPTKHDPPWFTIRQQPSAESSSPQPRLTMEFQRIASRSADLRCTLQISRDLTDWQTLAFSAGGDPFYIAYPYPFGMDWNPPLPVETPDTQNPDLRKITLTFPVSTDQPRLYFRLRVED